MMIKPRKEERQKEGERKTGRKKGKERKEGGKEGRKKEKEIQHLGHGSFIKSDRIFGIELNFYDMPFRLPCDHLTL